jgi:hypothetical protein
MNISSILFYALVIFCFLKIAWMLVGVYKSLQKSKAGPIRRGSGANRDKAAGD